ncbi:MAG: protein translocase subunit SecD [Clostridiales bacterium]|nr:protein translocase subunit SecD [Clostridiales bacterium]
MKKYKSITILTILGIILILGTVFAFVSLDKGELGLYNYKAFPKAISLGLDLSGGVYAVYDIDTEQESYAEMTQDEKTAAIEGTRAAMETLLFNKGYTEALVTVSGETIRVEIPDVDDPEKVFELIGDPAELEFKEYVDGKNDKSLDDQTGSVKLSGKLTGDDVAKAGVQYDTDSQYYVVALEFTADGTKKFATATQALTGKQLAIYINDSLVIAPTVNEAITTGRASISGNYTYDDAYALAVKITAGSFPLRLKMSQCSTISATLGVNAIKAGVIAGIAGVLLIMAYLIVLYRLLGVGAAISLWWYTLTFLFFLAVFPWVQLTLSGIAGVLLAIGMAVDANVIIFERIKEEYAMGKTIRTATSTGFRRSLGAIIDGNVTTIIGAVVLIILGTSTLKSFGITLLIGIVMSLISSLLMTRLTVACIQAFTREENAPLYNLFREEGVARVDVEEVSEKEGD